MFGMMSCLFWIKCKSGSRCNKTVLNACLYLNENIMQLVDFQEQFLSVLLKKALLKLKKPSGTKTFKSTINPLKIIFNKTCNKYPEL